MIFIAKITVGMAGGLVEVQDYFVGFDAENFHDATVQLKEYVAKKNGTISGENEKEVNFITNNPDQPHYCGYGKMESYPLIIVNKEQLVEK